MKILRQDADAIPSFYWDKKTGRYRYADTQRFLGRDAVTVLTQKRIDQVKQDINTIGDLLVSRKISLAAWQEATARSLKELHVQSFILNRGGKGQVTQSDYLAMGRELKRQYGFLRQFATDINRGYSLNDKGLPTPMTIGRFRARLGLYAESGKAAASLGEFEAQRDRGAIAMKRRLGSVDRHCPSCVSYAAADIQPTGGLPLPTQECECGNYCQCSVQWYTVSQLAEALAS